MASGGSVGRAVVKRREGAGAVQQRSVASAREGEGNVGQRAGVVAVAVHVLCSVEARDVGAYQEVAHRVDRVGPSLLQPCRLLGRQAVGGANARALRRAVDYRRRITIGRLRCGSLPWLSRDTDAASSNSGCYDASAGRFLHMYRYRRVVAYSSRSLSRPTRPQGKCTSSLPTALGADRDPVQDQLYGK